MTAACLVRQRRGGWWEDLLASSCAFPIAPLNTWSNLAYGAAGIGAYLAQPSAWGLAIGVLFGALGLASGWYHGAKTLTSSRADNAGIYALLTALMLHAAGFGAAWPAMLIGGAVAVAFAFGPYWRVTLEPVVGVLGLVTLATTAIRGSAPLAAISFALVFAALACWQADKARTFPWPKWGHAVWHVLTAAALLLAFLAAP